MRTRKHSESSNPLQAGPRILSKVIFRAKISSDSSVFVGLSSLVNN